jgi:hypothetical protein
MSEDTITPTIIRADKNFFLDGEKIGFFRPDGKLQMTPGNTEHRAALEAFIKGEAAAPEPLPQPEPLPAPAPKSNKEPRTKNQELATGIPPCPPMDPAAGDKTPAVIAWWFKYKPAEAAEKYKNRKFTIEAETSNS